MCTRRSVFSIMLIMVLAFSTVAMLPSFKEAAAAPPDFTFVAAGGFGCSSHLGADGLENGKKVLEKMAEHSPEVVLGLGGYSHQATMQCWHDDLDDFPTLHNAMHNPSFRPVALGDSESQCALAENCVGRLNSTGRAEFLGHFGIEEGATFYSFDHKGVHFVALDTTVSYGKGSAQ